MTVKALHDSFEMYNSTSPIGASELSLCCLDGMDSRIKTNGWWLKVLGKGHFKEIVIKFHL